MTIYFIRHTAVDVSPGYMYGFTDVGPKPTFEEEARKVKKQLAPIIFDGIYCSPLSRCVRLCTYCGYMDKAIKDDRLKELNFGEWEMKSFQELSADPRCQEWFDDWINYRIPGGESFTDQYNRVADFLEEMKASGRKQIAVFAHGGVITCGRVYAKEYGFDEAFSNLPDYGEVVRITI